MENEESIDLGRLMHILYDRRKARISAVLLQWLPLWE